MTPDFTSATWETCRDNGLTISGYLGGAGNVLLIANLGIGGTWNEAAAGVVILSSNGWCAAFGKTPHGAPGNAALGLAGTYVMQYPSLLAGDPLTLLGVTVFTLGTLPSLTEPFTCARAEETLERWRTEKVSLTHKPMKWAASWVLRGFAKSRVSYGVSNTMCLLPLMVKDTVEGNYHLLPVYMLWLAGNFFNGISRPNGVHARAASTQPQPGS